MNSTNRPVDILDSDVVNTARVVPHQRDGADTPPVPAHNRAPGRMASRLVVALAVLVFFGPARAAHQPGVVEPDRHLWDRMRAQPPSGYVDVHRMVEQTRHDSGRAYWSTDTHWLPETAARYGQELATAVDSRAASGTSLVKAGHMTRKTDLSLMIGRQVSESVPRWMPQRAGVTTTVSTGRAGGISYGEYTSTSTSAPLIPGRVVLLGDSFTELSAEQIVPYYSDVVFVRWTDVWLDYQAAARLERRPGDLAARRGRGFLVGGHLAGVGGFRQCGRSGFRRD